MDDKTSMITDQHGSTDTAAVSVVINVSLALEGEGLTGRHDEGGGSDPPRSVTHHEVTLFSNVPPSTLTLEPLTGLELPPTLK